MRKVCLIAWLALALSSVAFGGDQPKPKPPVPPKPPAPAAKPQQAAKQQASKAVNQQAQATQRALNATNLPAGLTLQRVAQLAHMSPEERATALSKLNPAMQQRIEQKVENFAKLTPEDQALALSKEERVQALTPERQVQVREALNELHLIQSPRKVVINNELLKLGSMTDEQRAAYMGKPGFQGRFSEQEIRMMNDLHGIVP
jgi:hypothetical protein